MHPLTPDNANDMVVIENRSNLEYRNKCGGQTYIVPGVKKGESQGIRLPRKHAYHFLHPLALMDTQGRAEEQRRIIGQIDTPAWKKEWKKAFDAQAGEGQIDFSRLPLGILELQEQSPPKAIVLNKAVNDEFEDAEAEPFQELKKKVGRPKKDDAK